MATQKEQVLQYKDLNAEKFPEPVEPINIEKYNICASTVDMKDTAVASLIGLFTIHSVVRRSLRCVARQARTVEPAQRAPFLTYTKHTFYILESHHHHEETLWFPIMKPYIDYEESSNEHEEIESLLHQCIEYTKTAEEHLKGGPKAPSWPGEEISSTTEKLIELLLPHLLKEETLGCLYGRRVPISIYEDFEKTIKKASQDEMKKLGVVWCVSYLLRHWNKKEKEVWPPVPGLVRAVIGFFGWVGYRNALAFGPTEEELKN
ncbi:hypothetical protein ABW20_dc0101382 [Dactylellina cionopaga]|nr:hypothetical protein ABW20_dc0101382 [Dactylellina cionopaga]